MSSLILAKWKCTHKDTLLRKIRRAYGFKEVMQINLPINSKKRKRHSVAESRRKHPMQIKFYDVKE